MNRFAYYIAAHHKPNQLQRLVKTLQSGSPQAHIVLHINESMGLIDPQDFASMQGVHIIPKPTRVEWGAYSQVEMNFNTLSWMIDNLSFDWVVYLSGQDYPLQPLETIERFYRSGSHDGYISGVPLESGIPCDPVGCPQSNPSMAGRVCADCTHRYYYRYYDINAIDNLVRRIPLVRRYYHRFKQHACRPGGRLHTVNWPAPEQMKTILGIRNDRLFDNDFRCYKGFSWFSLNRHAVERLLNFLDHNPSIVGHFRRTLMADEMVIQTILQNDAGLSICGDNQRFIEWKDENAPRPTSLTCAHYDQLIASGKHFARKFDLDSDAAIFDLLDQRVLGNV